MENIPGIVLRRDLEGKRHDTALGTINRRTGSG